MSAPWQPVHEPLLITLRRTVGIAVVVGVVAGAARQDPAQGLLVSTLALWFSLGGHWVEIAFLNGLRPRIPIARGLQVAARLAFWFAGGLALGAGMRLTATWLGGHPRLLWPAWWLPGLIFIAVELVAHLSLLWRGRPNFYDGRA